MGNRLNQLMNAVDLREVISTETEEKIAAVKTIVQPIVSPSTDFDEREIEEEEEELEVEEIEEEEPYDAEKNARSVVYGLQALDSLILVPLATLKVKNKAGGKKAIKAMQASYTKQMLGEELNEQDKRILEAFKTYKSDLEILQIDFIPNKQTTEEMIRLAMPWCEDNKIKFGSGMAFWMKYAANKVEQITKILLK
jgi:hypothetical protein